MSKSKIEWCDRVWNPVTGCTRVSPGCDNCYAIRQSHRFSAVPGKFSGTTQETEHGIDWSGKVTCHEDLLDMPLRWRKPSRIFVNSMSDLFHDDVPVEFIRKVLHLATVCSRHTFMILTKRPLRMKLVMTKWSEDFNCVLRNIWLGVSCENQAMADQRIPHLLKTPAAVRFVSYEPALGPIHIGKYFEKPITIYGGLKEFPPAIDWVICGGESGPGARPMHPDWARSVRDQCKAAGVAYFFKQWGEYTPWVGRGLHELHLAKLHLQVAVKCDGSLSEFVGDGGGEPMSRIGKKAAGRLLDGVEHSEWPEQCTDGGQVQ